MHVTSLLLAIWHDEDQCSKREQSDGACLGLSHRFCVSRCVVRTVLHVPTTVVHLRDI